MIVVLMGPAGAGKTTVGRALAQRLRWRFVDADDFHSTASRERMARGIALDDNDRGPWLAQLHAVVRDAADHHLDMVLACSALTTRHRALLAGDVAVHWVFLQAGRTLLHARLLRRPGHFAGPALLDAQLAELEPPLDAIVVDARQPVDVQVDQIVRTLGLMAG